MAESDLIRGNVDTVILKVLYEGDRYGYDLIKQINARSDGQWEIKQPTVYACLKRLEKQGFISSYWDSSESDGGRRKYYSLTDSGKEVFLKYKSEFERATALFGGIISGSEPTVFIQPAEDYSDVEEEGYSLPKRRTKKQPKQSERRADKQDIPATPEVKDTAPQKAEPVVTELPLLQPETPVVRQRAEQPTEQHPQKTERSAAQQPSSAAEALDPRAIIERYFATERGESYSDTQRKSTYTTTEPMATEQKPNVPVKQTPAEHAIVPEPSPAAAPAPVRPATAPMPAPQTPRAPVAQAEPTPPAPIGFASDDESPARREYKTVLEELVDRFAVTAPDVRSERAPAAEQAATDVQAEKRPEVRELTEVEQAVRDLGNDVKVRSHNNSAKEYTGKNYYYSNKLMMTHYTIMCAAMFIVGLALFLVFYMGLDMRMRYDYLLYTGAGLLPIAMFIAAVIRYAGNPDKKKRVNFNFKFFVIIRIVIAVQVAVVIYCLNLIWGMPLAFSEYYVPSVTLPLAYALFIPISEIVFMTLLKSGKYAVNE